AAAEEKVLVALLAANQSDLWPPLLNALVVAPGYEGALGAALGDDLTASADAGAPIHWQGLAAFGAPAALPAGAGPLTHFLRGPARLPRRLSQIGIVADAATGSALASQLVQGQRLVSRDGAMWRWDGFTVAAGTPTAAETRLRQRARLVELKQELVALRATLAEAEGDHGDKRRAADAAIAAERAWRDSFQARLRAADRARVALEGATQRAAATTARTAALQEASTATAADIVESEAQALAAQQDVAALPDLATVREQAAAERVRLVDL